MIKAILILLAGACLTVLGVVATEKDKCMENTVIMVFSYIAGMVLLLSGFIRFITSIAQAIVA